MDKNKTIIRSTTVVCVRDNESVVIASDGQVTLGTSVIKSNANKIRTFHNDQIIVGFAGSTADALTLFDRLEKKCEEFSYNLKRACVELAKDWSQ
jgi:ATP-dependent HslUV protease subunit HslV